MDSTLRDLSGISGLKPFMFALGVHAEHDGITRQLLLDIKNVIDGIDKLPEKKSYIAGFCCAVVNDLHVEKDEFVVVRDDGRVGRTVLSSEARRLISLRQ